MTDHYPHLTDAERTADADTLRRALEEARAHNVRLADLLGYWRIKCERTQRWAALWKRAAKFHRGWCNFFEEKAFDFKNQAAKQSRRAAVAEAELAALRAEYERLRREVDEAREESQSLQRKYEEMGQAIYRLCAAMGIEWLGDTYNPFPDNVWEKVKQVRAWAALWKRAAKENRARANSHADKIVTAMEKLLEMDAEITRLKVRLENAEDLQDQEVQERWTRFATGCPFQNSDDGTCGNDDNLTPECSVWACQMTIKRMLQWESEQMQLCGWLSPAEADEGVRTETAGECIEIAMGYGFLHPLDLEQKAETKTANAIAAAICARFCKEEKGNDGQD